MANELTTLNEQLPDYLQEYADKKAKLGNLDESDRRISRLILLQALSPQLAKFNEAKPGHFWHSLANISLGSSVKAVLIYQRKSVLLWPPRSESSNVPLARAMDGIHWDTPNAEFTVKPKGASHPITYKLKGNVKESGLLEFGSSVPGDSHSIPAASLTYNVIWFLPDFANLSPVLAINTRSQIKPTQTMFDQSLFVRAGEPYTQMWELGVVNEKGAEGPYYNFEYRPAGYVTSKEMAKHCEALYKRYEQMDWVPVDEAIEPDNGAEVHSAAASKY